MLPLPGRSHRVLAPDLPGYSPDTDYSPARLARFMDAVGLDNAAVGGNSLGGLGRAVNPALIAQGLPGIGKLAIAVGRRRPGAALRTLARAALLFGRPWRTPGPGCWSSTGPPANRVPEGAGEEIIMRHALITTHLLHQACDGAIAQPEADERPEHQTRAKPGTQPAERGRLARVGTLARRVRALAAGTT